MKRPNLFTNGRYPVYEALYEDGTICRLSVATCAKKYAKDGALEFQRMRQFMHNHKNPPFLPDGAKVCPNPNPPIAIKRGRVWLSDAESIEDPMRDDTKPKRVTAPVLKSALRELIEAVETPGADLIVALETARKLAA